MTDAPFTETRREPEWCATCRSWRHTTPCGREDCPSRPPPRPPELLPRERVKELWNRAFWEFNAEAMCELQQHERAALAEIDRLKKVMDELRKQNITLARSLRNAALGLVPLPEETP